MQTGPFPYSLRDQADHNRAEREPTAYVARDTLIKFTSIRVSQGFSESIDSARRAMQIQGFTCNPFETNCYVCHDDGEAVLIDPSCSTPEECAQVERYIADRKLIVRRLLLTHGHIDHIFGCAHFARTFGMGFLMHREDRAFIVQAEAQAQFFGDSIETPPEPEGFLNEEDQVHFGNTSLDVLHTPGHSPGSISFYDAASQALISGDVLFQGSIGRTDLWRGDLPELMRSIFEKLVPLGDTVHVYPGHGPVTTIGEERRTNPFLLFPS